jgi:hypothetical protein
MENNDIKIGLEGMIKGLNQMVKGLESSTPSNVKNMTPEQALEAYKLLENTNIQEHMKTFDTLKSEFSKIQSEFGI